MWYVYGKSPFVCADVVGCRTLWTIVPGVARCIVGRWFRFGGGSVVLSILAGSRCSLTLGFRR